MIEKYIVDSYCKEKVLQHRNEIILTFITHEYCTLMLNWYKHLEKIGLKNNVLVVCLDQQAFDFTSKNNIAGLYIDINGLVESQTEEVVLVKKAYIEKHHICKALILGYITKKYNTNVIHSDIDMIFLKNPFPKINTIIKDDYDMGVYMDKSYKELTTGQSDETGGSGFIIFYVTPTWLPKFISRLEQTPFLIDDDNVGVAVACEHFNNIKAYRFNSFLFTNYDIWQVEAMRSKLKNICYCIHYNTSENTWNYDMSYSKINKRNITKVERMKQYGHWLL